MKRLPSFKKGLRALGLGLVAAAIASLIASSSSSFALDLKADEIRGKSSKKHVAVLQNRYFLKAWRPEAGFVLGSLLDEAYTDTKLYGLRATLFVSEWLGVEAQMLNTSITDTADRKALNNLKYRPLEDENEGNAVPGEEEEIVVSPDPEINRVKGITDIHAIAAPFYGKLNLMNKWIIYTDLYVSGGLSTVETDQGDLSAFTIGAGERFYIGKAWSFRVDFKDRIYSESRAGMKSTKHGLSFDFGASYFFN